MAGVVAWGDNSAGQVNVPVLSNVVAVAAGLLHTLALKTDGTVVGWGDNSYDQCSAPAGLSNCVAISAGAYHSLAMNGDGEVVTWGLADSGQLLVLPGLRPAVNISAGSHHSAALGAVEPQGSPVISAQPQSQTNVEGTPATFTVTAAGSAPLCYQWRRYNTNLLNGSDVSGANTATLMFANVSTNDATGYTVVVTNTVGAATSSPPAQLTVLVPPVITQQPLNLTVTQGLIAVFSVAATGTPSPACQWRFNGADVAGATTSTLNWAGVQSSNAGNYTVVVSNSVGALTSSVASLTVLVPTLITA